MGAIGNLSTGMTANLLYLLCLTLMSNFVVDGTTTSETEIEDCYFDPTEEQVTVVADGYADVEGCYTLSQYSVLDRKIYTNDGGDVVNGSTIAILGSYVSVTRTVSLSSIMYKYHMSPAYVGPFYAVLSIPIPSFSIRMGD